MRMNLKDELVRSKIAIVGHVYATGLGHELEKYLKSRVSNLIFIGHPFPTVGIDIPSTAGMRKED